MKHKHYLHAGDGHGYRTVKEVRAHASCAQGPHSCLPGLRACLPPPLFQLFPLCVFPQLKQSWGQSMAWCSDLGRHPAAVRVHFSVTEHQDLS